MKKIVALGFGIVGISMISNEAAAWGTMDCNTADNRYHVVFNHEAATFSLNGKALQVEWNGRGGAWTASGHGIALSKTQVNRIYYHSLPVFSLTVNSQSMDITCLGH